MNPSRSMMKPLPEPWRGASKSLGAPGPVPPSGRICVPVSRESPLSRSSRPFEVESMFTTAAFIRSATSAKFTTIGPPVIAARAGSLAGGSIRGALDTIGAGVNAPAMISPTRNATMAESATVRSVKRFDMGNLFDYKRLQLLFRQEGNPEPLRLFELAARVGADDHTGRFAAHRAGHLATQTLDRRDRFLARHRLERARQHVCLPRQEPWSCGAGFGLLRAHVHTGSRELLNHCP